MAFDQTTRNRLAGFVAAARELLTEEFTRQLQQDYGLDPRSGDVAAMEKLSYLDDARRETAVLLRATLEHYLSGVASPTQKARQEALVRIVREQAFTVLNRLCALRMAEGRGLLIESVARGYQSRGFQLYGRLAGTALGETGDAYRCYLYSVFDELAIDLPVLFDRWSPQGRLFPRESTLLQLLDQINHPDIDALWCQDETIGWIYQYFNSKEERKAMRDASQAPRNSRELAVRNQFFTPRYVVEFLTDNTLGRIWYEMTRGETSLVDTCRYLVCRPNEIFLAQGEQAPAQDTSAEDLSQEELLRQPVHIPHRPLKDPRDLKMLDPACGSMHFGLYAFNLFERIYEEAWEIEATQGATALGRSREMSLTGSYPSKEALLRDIPRLIVERNIHGIDIDPRAVQIAGLSLWLRAQKCWHDQDLKPQERPEIRRSNIVCAEPMPGDTGLLQEFIARQLSETPEDRVIGAMLPPIFNAMRVAGEAGSLLKIEEEIAGIVQAARREYERAVLQQRKEEGYLPGLAPDRDTTLFDLLELPNPEEFWQQAEGRIYATLHAYAESAEDGDSYRRRLFADDAARGFAFIDLCRAQYDIVLMNPPFGAASNGWKTNFEKAYSRTKNDLYAAFVERGLSWLEQSGMLGSITSRTGFYLSSFQKWREDILLSVARPTVFADLGYGVLDAAMVETAAYCLSAGNTSETLFFRLLASRDKGAELAELVGNISNSQNCHNIFSVDPASIRKVPGSPFAYWVGEGIRGLFVKFSPFETSRRRACITNPAGDDQRYIRSHLEVPPDRVGRSIRWVPITRGGRYSPYYADVPQVVDWNESEQTYRGFVGTVHRPLSKPASLEYFFRPGITWPLRGITFSAQALPKGCIFSVAGKFVTSDDPAELPVLLGLMNSRPFDYLIGLFAGKVGGVQYEVGLINKIPVPNLTARDGRRLGELALDCFGVRRCLDQANETSHAFHLPTLLKISGESLEARMATWIDHARQAETQLVTGQRKIDDLAFHLYGIDGRDRQTIEESLLASKAGQDHQDTDAEANGIDATDTRDVSGHAAMVISYLMGSIVGRWDLRYTTGEKATVNLPDPFAPLPVCPPGMLQNAQGLPADPADVPADYPLCISWSGILADDEGHAEDIERRVRDALHVIWKDRADAIEQEACHILGVPSLRTYFRKPGGFFADHLSRYSKSRRQAPIYWPLSTPSGSYTLWLYYHRLTDQTLYTCVNDFVDPKLKQVAEDVSQLRQKSGRTRAEEKELERLSDLQLELQDFRAELLRIAAFWKPNLNDGVQITAAPLWKLFQHRPWRTRLKETWEKVEAGEYDWAHLAYSIWSDRVREKCRTDKSLAIAHDLEELYIAPPVQPKKPRGRTRASAQAPEG